MIQTYNQKEIISFKNKNMLGTFEPQNRAKNKNAEAHFKNPCSYKMKSVYMKPISILSPSVYILNPRIIPLSQMAKFSLRRVYLVA